MGQATVNNHGEEKLTAPFHSRVKSDTPLKGKVEKTKRLLPARTQLPSLAKIEKSRRNVLVV